MTDYELERMKSQRQWYTSELSRFPGNEWIKDIRDEESRRRREADQGRLFWMKAHRRNINSATVESANTHGLGYVDATIALARAFLDDSDKSKRRKAGLCKLCYYQSSRIGGCASTHAQCGLCDEQIASGNTNIDVLCQSCAVANGFCKHCGADLEFINRRKRVLPKPTPDWTEDK